MGGIHRTMIKLYDYQDDAIVQAYSKSIKSGYFGNSILDFDMGFGKTVCALAYWQRYFPEKLPLVIAPASVRDAKVWEKEFERFIGENGAIKSMEVESYAKLDKMQDVENRFIIFDECHALKNPTSNRSKYAQKMCRNVKNNFLLLSGTTHPNGWYDVAGYFVLFGESRNKTDFYKKYVEQKPAPFGNFLQIVGYKNTRKLVITWMNMATRKDLDGVRELPSQIFIDVRCQVKCSPLAYSGGVCRTCGESFDNISQAMAHLRENAVKDDEKQLSALLEQGQRMVIFYQTNAELAKIQKAIVKYNKNAKIAYVNGKRHDDTTGKDYVVAQYVAGSQGLNLQEYNYTVFFAPTYSWQDYVQAVARTYRTGQQRKTVFYKFKGGLYNNIWQAIENKKDFNVRVFERMKK